MGWTWISRAGFPSWLDIGPGYELEVRFSSLRLKTQQFRGLGWDKDMPNRVPSSSL